MGVLASTQRVPLTPFQTYQTEWRLRDVQTILNRFEREPTSFGFKITYKTYQTLVKDLPIKKEEEDDSTPMTLEAAKKATATGKTPLQSPHPRPSFSNQPTPAHQQQQQLNHTNTGLTLPHILPPFTPNHHATAAGPQATPRSSHPTPHRPSVSAESEEKEAIQAAEASLPLSSPKHLHEPHPPTHHHAPHTPSTGGRSHSDHYAQPLTAHEHHHHAPPTIHPPQPFVPHQHTPKHPHPTVVVPNNVSFQTPIPIILPSPTNPVLSSEQLFNLWVGPDIKDDDRLDLLIFLASLICLCRARYETKLRTLFSLFDFDEDGILNRHELSQLVRCVAIGLHRVYGVGVVNPPNFSYATGEGIDRHSSTQPHEPNLKQCERWNEQHVRRFEPALRTGVWDLEGFLEWSSSSALVVHLLGVGMRTRTGASPTLDAQRVQTRLQEAQQRFAPSIGYQNAGGNMYSIRGASNKMGAGSREEALLGLSLQTPPTRSQTPRSQTAREMTSSNSRDSAMEAAAAAVTTPRSGSTVPPPSNSAAAAIQNRFKFTGRNTAREVKNLKKLFDDMDIDSSGYLSLEYLRKPKKYTDPFLLRDITAVFQEWKPVGPDGQLLTIHPKTEVSFNELLDVLYHDLTPEQHKLMHSWIPAPVNKESVKALQSIFDRLDTEFTGKVKFSKVMNCFKTEHASNETYQKLIEPFSRLRPHRLEIAVNIRELLTALFNRTHSKQLKKILNWSRPSKQLTSEQQHELIRLFQRYDTRNEGRFPIAHLKQHLLERGLPQAEVEKMMEDIHISTEGQLRAQAAATAATASLTPMSHTSSSMKQPNTGGASPHHHLHPSQTYSQTIQQATLPNSSGSFDHDPNHRTSSKPPTPDLISLDEPMITLQEFQLFYRDMWDSYVNFDIHSLSFNEWSSRPIPPEAVLGAGPAKIEPITD